MVLKQKMTSTNISTVIKVCLDTNIFISALLFDRKPEDILFLGSKGKILIILSPAILEEIKEVLLKKFKFPETEVKKMLKSISSITKTMVPSMQVKKLNYQKDNKILEAALEGQVDYIITGDKKHLLPLKKFKNIPIIAPDQFLGINQK